MIAVGCCCLRQQRSGKQDMRNLLTLFLKAPIHQKLHCVHVQGVMESRTKKSKVEMHLVTRVFDENFVKDKGNVGIFLNDDRDLNVGPPDDASSANNMLSVLIRGATSGIPMKSLVRVQRNSLTC